MLNGCAYILTVDVGNTFIRFGLFAEDSAAAQECSLATCEITTPSSITADEARMRLAQVMGALAADAGMPGALVPAAAVLSCVVPALERPWKAALSRTCTGRVLTVGPGLKTGMPVHYDDPAEIGPDRIADAVAAPGVHRSFCRRCSSPSAWCSAAATTSPTRPRLSLATKLASSAPGLAARAGCSWRSLPSTLPLSV